MKTTKKLLGTMLLASTFLVGCTTQNEKIKMSTYIHDDVLEIQSENGDNVSLPYKETMTIESDEAGFVTKGTDDIVYQMTDKYLEENPKEKDVLLKNLKSGVEATYIDTNPEAIKIKTEIKGEDKTELHVNVSVDFKSMKDKNAVVLFGLTDKDFNEEGKATLTKVEEYMESSGFIKK